MKKRTLFHIYTAGAISPWLHAAAIGLLVIIIFVFAVNNIRRDKEYLTQSLFNKGQAIIRFVGAGTRSAMMMGSPDILLIQNLIEQAAENADIHYIIVVDQSGLALAHSNPELVDSQINMKDRPLNNLDLYGTWHIFEDSDIGGKIFEVVSPFQPFKRGRGKFRKRMMELMQNQVSDLPPEKDMVPHRPHGWRDSATCQGPPQENWRRMFEEKSRHVDNMFIMVGLDAHEMEAAIKQNRLQMLVMALVLLLIGIGGWLSLLTAQGYRISQATLSRMQAFTSLLISKLPMGIIATDADGIVNTFNTTAELLLDISGDDVLGKKAVDILPADLTQFLVVPQHGEISGHELFLKDDHGGSKSIHLASVPVFDAENSYSGRVLLLHDMTEIKNLEAKLRRQDRFAALGKMAAGVAHEVRNPLSSIKGFATMLGSKFLKNSDEHQTAALLVNEVERLNRSITELLNYTKPFQLHLVDIDVAEILEISLRLIEAELQENKISVKLDLADDLPMVKVDPDKINQLLLNVFLNAIQAMENGGNLAINITPAKDGRMVQITIQDNGIGIAPEDLEHILDPYFTTKKQGTGLGLAIAQKIIEEHGGAIRFSSEIHHGTMVTILLPATQQFGRQELSA